MRPAIILAYMFIMIITIFSCTRITRKEFFVSVDDYRIYVEETGRGDPVIMLHGGFLDHRMWEEQVNDLSKTFRVITLDMPGHGETVNGDSTLMINEILKKVMDTLEIAKANFIGLSLGAVAVTDFAIAYPDRCDKIILAAPGLVGWDFKQDSVLVTQDEDRRKTFIEKDTLGFAESFVKSWTDGPNRSPDQIDEKLRSTVKQCVYENIKHHQFSHWPGFTEIPPASEVLDSIKSPVLIIVGNNDMKDIIMITNLMESKIPNVRKITLDGVAHMVNLEKPIQFNEEVKNFLVSDR
ncbi:MAG TPA: alpha/beta hydrolase [Chryseolinea sp.]|nr:alpha/beta hydrolase [Chryseolinea sp.]